MALNQEDGLLIQSYMTVMFLTELKNNNFLNSGYYQQMNFGDQYVKANLPSIGIDNQGALLMFLYAMLVLPKQLLKMKYPDEFLKLNDVVDKIKISATSNYSDNNGKIDYIYHIRNAVAHARVEFVPNISVKFSDERIKKKEKEVCQITLPLSHVGLFLMELERVFFTHIRTIQNNQSKLI